jgi:hypothetical protein
MGISCYRSTMGPRRVPWQLITLGYFISREGRKRVMGHFSTRATIGHAAAPPSPAMNSRRRIRHASGPLFRAAYRGLGRLETAANSVAIGSEPDAPRALSDRHF